MMTDSPLMHQQWLLTMIIVIRHAELADVPLLFSFICKKAEFDRSLGAFSGVLQITEIALQETLLNQYPFARALVVEADQQPLGFGLYYFRYSSFKGRPSLWLDDLYIDEPWRGQGAGTLLFQHLVKIAQENRCTSMAWNAAVNNDRAIRFYQKMGAVVTDQQRSTLHFQLDLQNENGAIESSGLRPMSAKLAGNVTMTAEAHTCRRQR
jgi:GNAT superfamily N-acetyltransferase